MINLRCNFGSLLGAYPLELNKQDRTNLARPDSAVGSILKLAGLIPWSSTFFHYLSVTGERMSTEFY